MSIPQDDQPHSGGLPHNWERPEQTLTHGQLTLFPVTAEELGASGAELLRWHQRGWLSFDPSSQDAFDADQQRELTFVASIVGGGLDAARITQMLAELDSPYLYDPTRTAYSFLYGWVQVPRMPTQEDADAFIWREFDGFIERRVIEADLDSLMALAENIRDRVDGARRQHDGSTNHRTDRET